MSILNIFEDSEFREERDSLSFISLKLEELERQFPEWITLFDNTSPDIAPRAEVVKLMATAPNPFALGVLFGKYTMRQEIAAMTGREWV